MDRLSFYMATELQEHNVHAVTIQPSEGQTEVTEFPYGETPTYVGRSILALLEKAGSDFLIKANGKTLFTAELAEQFGFSEDHDKDGALNRARLKGLKPFRL